MLINYLETIVTQISSFLTTVESYFVPLGDDYNHSFPISTMSQVCENGAININAINLAEMGNLRIMDNIIIRARDSDFINEVLLEQSIDNLEQISGEMEEILFSNDVAPISFFHSSFSMFFNQVPFFNSIERQMTILPSDLFLHLKEKIMLVRMNRLPLENLVKDKYFIHFFSLERFNRFFSSYLTYIESEAIPKNTQGFTTNFASPSEVEIAMKYSALITKYEVVHSVQIRQKFFQNMIVLHDESLFNKRLNAYVRCYFNFKNEIIEFKKDLPLYNIYDTEAIKRKNQSLLEKAIEIERIISDEIKPIFDRSEVCKQ